MTTGLRDRVKALSPDYLQDGVGEREMYVPSLMADGLDEMAFQGIKARIPTLAPEDAIPTLCADRLIDRGITETLSSIQARLQKAFETWQLAGSARSVLSALRGMLLSFTPRVREVCTRYSGNPADLLFVSAATNESPIVVTTRKPHDLRRGESVTIVGVLGNTAANTTATVTVLDPRRFSLTGTTGNGTYTGGGIVYGPRFSTTYPPTAISTRWDTYEPDRSIDAEPERVTVGSGGNFNWGPPAGWWQTFDVLYAVSPNTFVTPGPKWGSGRKWGPGMAWGISESADHGRGWLRTIATFKGAHSWCRMLIVSFDMALFNPAGSVGPVNPDGFFHRWSKVSAGAYVRARFSSARYSAGVV